MPLNNITNIIFDWKGTLYNSANKCLIEGTTELLELLQNYNIPVHLIGKGGQDMCQEVRRLEVEKYFGTILFVDEAKNIKHFVDLVNKINSKLTLVIGDRIQSELSVGKSLNTTTIWIQNGKFSDQVPRNESEQPDFVVNNLIKLMALFSNSKLIRHYEARSNPKTNY